MSFILPHLSVESVLRDGLDYLRANPELIDNVFSQLIETYASTKYGELELARIKKLLQKEIPIVHSFSAIQMNVPCISIQLGAETKDQSILDDFNEDNRVTMDDPNDLADLIVVSSAIATAYDTFSGIVSISDAANLANVYKNLIFVDANNVEHVITGAINTVIGSKSFGIAPGSEVTLGTGSIKSGLNYKQYETRSTMNRVNLLLGIHAKEALEAIYLYTLVKYFLVSRKAYLDARNFFNPTLAGSDFNQNLRILGDQLHHRFLTLTGSTEDTWRSDEVGLIDNINITVEVPLGAANNEDPLTGSGGATTEDLDKEDQTIQVGSTIGNDDPDESA